MKLQVLLQNGTMIDGLVDSGSEISLISVSHIQGMELLPADKFQIRSATGHELSSLGKVVTTIYLDTFTTSIQLTVVPASQIPCPMVLGLDWLESKNALINTRRRTVTLDQVEITARPTATTASLGLTVAFNSDSPPRVTVYESYQVNSGEAGYLKLITRSKVDPIGIYLFLPSEGSLANQMLFSGVVQLDGNNCFNVIYVNVGEELFLKKNTSVGHLVRIEAPDGSLLEKAPETRQGSEGARQEARDGSLLAEAPAARTKASAKPANLSCSIDTTNTNRRARRIDGDCPERRRRIMDLLQKQDMQLTPQQKDLVIERLLEYADVLALSNDPLQMSDKFQHKIRVNPHSPIFSKPYPIPHAYREEVRSQIKSMSEAGIIEPSRSPYNSPLLIVKREDSVRLVCDYRKINEFVVPYRFPIPELQNLLERLSNSCYFTNLDVRKAFLNIPLHPDSRELTAFSVPDGSHWQYTAVTFGFRDSPSCFQNIIQAVLAGLEEWALAYIDDIMVLGKNFEDHLNKILGVLERMREAKLTIKLEKCRFFQKKIQFLGHEISTEGIRPLADRVKAIRDLAAPKTVRQVRQILGIFGFYRRFVKNYAKIARPITNLLKNESKSSRRAITWTEEADQALERLKDELLNRVCLRFPDFNHPFEVASDASLHGLGCVLQQSIRGETRPIAFFSRVLTEPETRYHSLEIEAMGIVFSLRQTRRWTLGHPVKIVTDCRGLIWLLTTKKPLGRILRWQVEVAAFDFEISFLAGKLNNVSDALSRLKTIHHQNHDAKEDDEELEGPPLVCAIRRSGNNESSLLGDLTLVRISQREDLLCQRINKALINPSDLELSIQIGKMMRREFKPSMFVIKGGILYLRSRASRDLPKVVASLWSRGQKDGIMKSTSPVACLGPEGRSKAGEGSASGQLGLTFLDQRGLTRIRHVSDPKEVDRHVDNRIRRESDETRRGQDGVLVRTRVDTEHDRPESSNPTINPEEEPCDQRDQVTEKESCASRSQEDSPENQTKTLESNVVTTRSILRKRHEYGIPEEIQKLAVRKCIQSEPTPPDEEYFALVVPESLKLEVLRLTHDNDTYGTHKSANKMYLYLKKITYWPNMRKDVGQYVASCEVCAMYKKQSKYKVPMRQWKTPSQPNERIHIDLLGPLDKSTRGHQYVLVIIDSFSKFVTLIPLRTKTAEEVGKALVHRYIAIFGCPNIITSDRGLEFANAVIKTISELHGIKQILIAPRHPSSNGQVERFNLTVCNLLRPLIQEQVRSWPEALPLVASSLNSSYCRAIEDTPHYLMFLREPFIPIEAFKPPSTTKELNVSQYRDRLILLQSRIYKRVSALLDRNFKELEKHQKRRKMRSVTIGERVFIAVAPQPYRPTKLQKKFDGPYRVIGRVSDVIVRVIRLKDRVITEAHLDNTLVVPERSLLYTDNPNVRRAYPIHDDDDIAGDAVEDPEMVPEPSGSSDEDIDLLPDEPAISTADEDNVEIDSPPPTTKAGDHQMVERRGEGYIPRRLAQRLARRLSHALSPVKRLRSRDIYP